MSRRAGPAPASSFNLLYENMVEFIHPEKKEDEVFFTNASGRQFKWMRWVTKRKGVLAYDGEGNPLNQKNWFPVFIKKEELDQTKADLKTERKTFWQVVKQLTQ